MALNRRQMLLASGAALLGPAVASRALATPPRLAGKKLLFFTKSSGFQHSVITRKGDALSLAETILTKIGKDHGVEVVCSKDGTNFDPDKIGQWDGFAFETTGVLTTPGDHKDGPPMSKDGKKAFLDAIRDGKGFMGMHCATDTFHSQGKEIDPYIEMIGGEFIVHGDQQKVKLEVADPSFPGVSDGFGTTAFEINDEWYAQKNQPDDLHVILYHDTSSFKNRTTGNNKAYDRPNFPQTWTRMHGKGRVFYTSMGHREDVWENPKYQGLLLGAMTFILGMADADTKPNVTKVTPDFHTHP
jgi:type 1 glutamine amidotransferase